MPEDGRIKLFLIHRALQARRANRRLFQHGAYQKLTVIGSLKSHVVAFARDLGERRALVVVPRFRVAWSGWRIPAGRGGLA